MNSKILLVDDEKDIVDLIDEVLQRDGFQSIEKVYSGGKISGFFGRQIILPDRFTSKYGIQKGDTVTLQTDGTSTAFEVAEIAAYDTVFLRHTRGTTALLPYNTLAGLTGQDYSYKKSIWFTSCNLRLIIGIKEVRKMKDAVTTIGNLIDKQSVGFISSVDEDGYPNMKAMLAPRKRDGIKTFYFHTNTSSMRVNQYKSNPHASIYFCDKRFYRGVMLLGTMEVLEDSKHKEMLWREGDTMYYPEGVTDPDYCVLRFTAKQGRFYSNFRSETFEIV